MKENVVAEKSYSFALRIVKAYKFLNSEQREFILSKQLLRSGTAIGARVKEAE
jgi:four helix bundle protein